jgi:hypothetical protein
MIEAALVSNLSLFVDNFIGCASAEENNFRDIHLEDASPRRIFLDNSILQDVTKTDAALMAVKGRHSCCYDLCISGECTLSPIFWSRLNRLINNFYTVDVQRCIRERGLPDVRASPVCRRLLQEFVSCQYFIMEFFGEHDAARISSTFTWAAPPSQLRSVRIVDLHAPICLEAYGLKNLVGPELSMAAVDIVDNFTDVVNEVINCRSHQSRHTHHSRSLHAGKDEDGGHESGQRQEPEQFRKESPCAHSICSAEYRALSVEAVAKYCKIGCSHVEDWKPAVDGYVSRFAVPMHQRTTQDAQSGDDKEREVSDERTFFAATALRTVHTVVLRDCLIAVLHTRYFGLLSDDEQVVALVAINKTWKSMGLEMIPTNKVLVDNLLLGMGFALQLFSTHVTGTPGRLTRLRSVLVNAAPERSAPSDPVGSRSRRRVEFPRKKIDAFLVAASFIPESRPLRRLLATISLCLISLAAETEEPAVDIHGPNVTPPDGQMKANNFCIYDKTVLSTLLLEDIFGVSFQELFRTDPAQSMGSTFSIVKDLTLLDDLILGETGQQDLPDVSTYVTDIYDQLGQEYSATYPVIKLRSSSEVMYDLFILFILLKQFPISAVFSSLWADRMRQLHVRNPRRAFARAAGAQVKPQAFRSELAYNYESQFSVEENNKFLVQANHLEEGWQALAREIERPLRVLKCCFQSLDIAMESTAAVRPTWREFQGLLELAIKSGEYDSGHSLASETVYALLQRTHTRLNIKEGFVLLTAVAFQLFFDNNSGIKHVMNQLMSAAKGDGKDRLKGLASVRGKQVKKDDSSTKNIGICEDAGNRNDDDDDIEEGGDDDEDEEETDVLTERSKSVLKEVLFLLTAHTRGLRRDQFRSNINSMALITINLPQWVEWAGADPTADIPLSGYNHFSVVEKFFIAAEIKPIAVIGILQKEINEAGLSLPQVSLFAESLIVADVHNRIRRSATITEEASTASARRGFLQVVRNSDSNFNLSYIFDVKSAGGEDFTMLRYFWCCADGDIDILEAQIFSKRRERERILQSRSESATVYPRMHVESLSSTLASCTGTDDNPETKVIRGDAGIGKNDFDEPIQEELDNCMTTYCATHRRTAKSDSDDGGVSAFQTPVLNVHIICMSSSVSEWSLVELNELALRLQCCIYFECNFAVIIPRCLPKRDVRAYPTGSKPSDTADEKYMCGATGTSVESRGFYEIDIIPTAGINLGLAERQQGETASLAIKEESEDPDGVRVQSVHSMDFVSVLKHSVSIIRMSFPRHLEPEFSNALWLLSLTHTAIKCKLAGQGPPVGDDILRAAASVLHLICLTSAKALLLDATTTESSDPANFLHYLVNCIYCRYCESELKHSYIQSIVSSFYTAGCTNATIPYYIRGLLELPAGFSSVQEADFLLDLSTLLNKHEMYPSDLMGSSTSELNSRAYGSISAVIDHFITYTHRSNQWQVLDTFLPPPHWARIPRYAKFMSLGRTTAAARTGEYFTDVSLKCVLYSLRALRAMLPCAIDLEGPRILDKMVEKNIIHQEQQKYKGKKKGDGYGQGHGHGHSHHYKKDSKVHQTTREFDPLWAFVVSETIRFNQDISGLIRIIDAVCSSRASFQQFLQMYNVYVDENEYLHKFSHSAQQILESLSSFRVPCCWLTGEASYEGQLSVTFELWTSQMHSRREMLQEWLEAGYPTTVLLHLVVDNQAMLHCMKEYFALKNNVSVEKLSIDTQVIELKQVSDFSVHKVYLEKMGCAVLATNIQLHNARYSSGTMVFSPQYSANSYGQVRLLFEGETICG